MQALLLQCSTKGLPECFGEVESGDRTENTVDAFIDVHWKSERNTYIDAVLALNYETLNKITKNGIFPHWTTQAIDAVTKANLPLEDKRRRTAWLFRDAQQLARAPQSTDVLNGLIGWMPREDWSPIIKANQDNPWMLESLHDEADRQGKHTLACRFLTALKRTYGKVTKNQEAM